MNADPIKVKSAGSIGVAMRKGEAIKLAIPLAILIATIVAPTPAGLSLSGKLMIGLLFFAASLWLTEVVPFAITGLVIMILPPILGISTGSAESASGFES